MITLEGKPVTEKIIERITEKQAKLTKQPCLAVLGIKGDDASNVYIGYKIIGFAHLFGNVSRV